MHIFATHELPVATPLVGVPFLFARDVTIRTGHPQGVSLLNAIPATTRCQCSPTRDGTPTRGVATECNRCQSLGRVAIKASNPARSSSDNVSSNSCSRRFFLSASCQQESLAHR